MVVAIGYPWVCDKGPIYFDGITAIRLWNCSFSSDSWLLFSCLRFDFLPSSTML